MASFDADPFDSASHANAFAHLTPPFRGGADELSLTLDAAGHTRVDLHTREPLLLVGTKSALGASAFEVVVTITPDAPSPAVPPEPPSTVTLRFGPYTEPGAFLPAYRPNPNTVLTSATPGFSVSVAKGAGAPTAVAVADLVDVRLVTGTLGRLLYIMGAEKQRVRRQSRELTAARRVDGATGDALDRIGRDVGVPRFADQIGWDATQKLPTNTPARESDDAYRARLAIYRPTFVPTRTRVLEALNGRDPPTGDVGLPSRVQLNGPFDVREPNSEFAMAIQLAGSSPDLKTAFLQTMRDRYMLSPGAAVPATRLLPPVERAAQEAMLARLQAQFDFPPGSFVVPLLAEALDRVARCRAAWGITRKWKVFRAQADDGGSRYELGLGIEVEALPAAELDAMAAASSAAAPPNLDVNTATLVGALTPASSGNDPAARWLLVPAGLRTVHATTGGRYYLSHFPAYGLVLGSTSVAPAPAPAPGPIPAGPGTPGASTATLATPSGPLNAVLMAPGDVRIHSALWHALRDAEADALAAAIPAWTRLTATDANTALNTCVPPSTVTLTALASAGLGTPAEAEGVAFAIQRVRALAPELTLTVRLPNALSTALTTVGADPSAVRTLMGILQRREVTSVLPLVTPAGIVLVLSVVGLHGGTMLNRTRDPLRWYVLPISGAVGTLDATQGSINGYTTSAPGLSAIVAMTLVHKNTEDPRDCIPPYQARVELPPGVLMDLPQYEYLLNLLERAAPLGIVVDTSALRTGHVDPAHAGTPIALSLMQGRAFRRFRASNRSSNVDASIDS